MTTVDPTLLGVFQEFKAAAEAATVDTAKANALLLRLKARLVPALPAAREEVASGGRAGELLLLRETLETALLLSVRLGDVEGFARHYAQLRPLYIDLAGVLQPPSPRERLVVGLNLTRLLSQNRIADFHTELERVPHDVRLQDRFIRFPVELEQLMAEGNYGLVLRARREVPADCYALFVDTLAATVRDDIADCSERAYVSLAVADARRMLLFADADPAFDAYAAKRGWQIRDGRVWFPAAAAAAAPAASSGSGVPAHKLIHDTLGYCRELERIV